MLKTTKKQKGTKVKKNNNNYLAQEKRKRQSWRMCVHEDVNLHFSFTLGGGELF